MGTAEARWSGLYVRTTLRWQTHHSAFQQVAEAEGRGRQEFNHRTRLRFSEVSTLGI